MLQPDTEAVRGRLWRRRPVAHGNRQLHGPSIEEWLALAKGCDGTTGTPEDASFQSTCEWDGVSLIDCSACESGEGPGNGCYWPAGMGACLSESPYDYWSSTDLGPGYPLYFTPLSSYVYFRGAEDLLAVRCVTDKP